MSQHNERRGLLLPAVVAGVGFAVLFGLGTWQIERKQWKEALIEALRQRAAATAVALPPKSEWPKLTQAKDEFRRVTFRAQFVPREEAFVYTVGSPLRPDVSGPGYWVFAPARLAEGARVVVNRGFLPQEKRDAYVRLAENGTEAVDLVGALRWPESHGWFVPADSPEQNLWYVRDHLSMAAAKGWGEVAPFLVDQEAPMPPGGVPRPGPLAVQLRNDHLQYALTWYGLAIVLAAVFAIWARGRRAAASTGK